MYRSLISCIRAVSLEGKKKLKKRGQGTIEFIIIIPLLIAIVFGMIEIALYWRAAHVVQQIAMEAGVIASRGYVDPKVTTNIAQY